MVFNSYTFLIFFILVLGLYSMPLGWRVRKTILLLGSYVFYAAWNPPFVILLWISTLADWFLARAIHRTGNPFLKKLALAGSLLVNLGLLGFFKYSGFILENFLALSGALNLEFQLAAPSIILPVGISFYTFQTLSYTLDIYREKAEPSKSFLDYALYVTFFPQLVAGPIVRATHFLPQCVSEKKVRHENLGTGLAFLMVGLFEKVVMADALFAPTVDAVYSSSSSQTFWTAWSGTLAFAGQIFCDFAGYSTCAIGLALILGFDIPVNFRFPYAAKGFSDFWGRWHISLSTWIRDYIYIPLGGNKNGTSRTLLNLIITMFLGGLWHGAAWTFVIWGLLHGCLLVAERILVGWVGHLAVWKTVPGKVVIIALTFLAVCLTWVFFRAGSLSQAMVLLGHMLFFIPGAEGADPVPGHLLIISGAAILSLLAVHLKYRNRTLTEILGGMPKILQILVLAGILIALFICNGDDRAFIYFQF